MIIETKWTETGWTYRFIVERLPPPGDWIGFWDSQEDAIAAAHEHRRQFIEDLKIVLPGAVPLLRLFDVLD